MPSHLHPFYLGSALALVSTTVLMPCSKTPEAAPATPPPSISAGTQVDDVAVTARVKTALLADPGIKSLDISVVTFKGEVQLTGLVDNQAQVDQAAQLARAAEGSTGVKNELKVKP